MTPRVRNFSGAGILSASLNPSTLLAIALLAITPLGLMATSCGDNNEPDNWIEIRGNRVILERAITSEEQRRGLGYREHLPWGEGMIFSYGDADFRSFWMKGMEFDIDIVWIREHRIVGISHSVPHVDPWQEIPSVQSPQLTDTVLEVPSGYAGTHGWRVGDPVKIKLTPRS